MPWKQPNHRKHCGLCASQPLFLFQCVPGNDDINGSYRKPTFWCLVRLHMKKKLSPPPLTSRYKRPRQSAADIMQNKFVKCFKCWNQKAIKTGGVRAHTKKAITHSKLPRLPAGGCLLRTHVLTQHIWFTCCANWPRYTVATGVPVTSATKGKQLKKEARSTVAVLV